MQIQSLQWDEDNLEHIARHQAGTDEVEDVCFSAHLRVRGRYGRYVVYGQSASGRYLMVVLESLGEGSFRPVTARDMSPGEKQAYRRHVRR